MDGSDIEIVKDTRKGCNIIKISGSLVDFEVWQLASKLQKLNFGIKKYLKGGYVFNYDPESFDESEQDDIETVVLEYEYNGVIYICEIGDERLIMRPIFPSEDLLRRKIYECIVDPASVYYQTAVENLESAELNLSIGSIRSASSDIYYAVHSLLKSIQFSYTEDEKLLISDNHPPIFLANVRKDNDTDNSYEETLKQSFNSQLGRINTSYVPEILSSLQDLTTKSFERLKEYFNDFEIKISDIRQQVEELCKARVQSDNSHYNFYSYLQQVEKELDNLPNVSSFLKNIILLVIATYEARVLGDYKFNFETLLSRDYISLLHWFAEEFIGFIKYKNSPYYARRLGIHSVKVTELQIVASKKAKNAILAVIKVSGNTFDPIMLKDILFEEWGNSISVIGWEKDFPIKLQILQSAKVPINIEILQGNQIDIFASSDKEKGSLDEQFTLIESTIENVYNHIVANWPNVLVKLSPVTLTQQHKIIKDKDSKDSRNYYLNKRRTRDRNLANLLKELGSISTEIPLLRNVFIEVNGERNNFLIIDFELSSTRPPSGYISEIIGNSFMLRSKLVCKQTIAFLNQDIYDFLLEKNYLSLLNEAQIQLWVIPVRLWELLTEEDLTAEIKVEMIRTIQQNINLEKNYILEGA